MARAPKKTEDNALIVTGLERAIESQLPFEVRMDKRIWVLEQAVLTTCKPYIAGGKAHCGICLKPLAEVYDTGCGIIDQTTAVADACPHKAAE